MHTLFLALRNLKSYPLITLVNVLVISLGVGVSTTLITTYHLPSQDPIPSKSDKLFNVRVDSWDPDSQFFDVRPGDPPKHITYQDMTRLMQSDIPTNQTGIANAMAFIFPENSDLGTYQTVIRLCHSGFFSLTDAPFAYGAGWSPSQETSLEPVVVLSDRANQKLFGGTNSVGRTVRINQNPFRVTGVLAPWTVTPQYYDVINNQLGSTRDFFVPFDWIRNRELGLNRTGDSDSWGNFNAGDNPDSFFTASESCWIQFWVELEGDKLSSYKQFVDQYTLDQKKVGRFPRPLNNHVTPLMEWMRIRDVPPPPFLGLVVISILFLAICSFNIMGLLLGKFTAKAKFVGILRALGATRRHIFMQHLAECLLVGVMGGVVGLFVALYGVSLFRDAVPDRIMPPEIITMDMQMFLLGFVLSILASMVSGLYPAWRICRTAPAVQMKLD